MILKIVDASYSTGLSGQNGRDGVDGARGEMGYQGPPGRKVKFDWSMNPLQLCFSLKLKGDRGTKGEAGYIQKVDFNSTHIVMMGPPGLPGPKVKKSFYSISLSIFVTFPGTYWSSWSTGIQWRERRSRRFWSSGNIARL
jgi:hypothetical protein